MIYLIKVKGFLLALVSDLRVLFIGVLEAASMIPVWD